MPYDWMSGMRVRHHGSLLALLTVTLLCGAGGASAQNSVASDKAALVALYNAAGGLNWTNHGNWTSTEPLSTWFGVATDGDGRVTGLALGTNGLTGTIPGQLGNLSELRTLDLHDNSLTGPIPAELGDLSELRTLDFGENYRDGQDLPGLSGPIPAALGRLSNLLSLDLGGNSLSGVIPTELGGLSHLQGLFLALNELTGEIPDSLQNLSNLRVLSLSANRLTGSIPSWLGSLSPLESLGLSFNRQDGLGLPGLTGPIPEELGNLANLKVLALQFNGLSGTIPTELGSLSSLTRLGLGSNRLSGAIPTELRNLPNIVQLYLDQNDLIGTIPDALWDLTTLEALGVEDNRLSGELPLDLPSRSSPLTGLYIASNNNLCAPADDAFQAWLKPIDFSGSTCSPTSESVIDVAVFYTEAARIAEQGSENGSDAIEALIDLMIVEANGAFTEGGANVRLSLVHREEVTYTEQGTAEDDLLDLRARSEDDSGPMDEIHAIRDRVGADLIHLIVSPPGGDRSACGIAFLMSAVWNGFERSGFSVSRQSCTILALAHEIGHNMGLAHDRYQCSQSGDTCRGAYPYSRGYVNQRAFDPGAAANRRWRTIMAYSSQCRNAIPGFDCRRLSYFSNANRHISYSSLPNIGDPLGVPGEQVTPSVTGPADAIRSLRRTRETVARFRTSVVGPVTISFDAPEYSATEGETATVTVSLNPSFEVLGEPHL